MKIINLFFLIVALTLLAAWNLSYLFPYTLFAIIAYFASKSKNNVSYGYLLMFSFYYFSIMGVLAMISYDFFCGNTFAPYNDDSYYYRNVNEILTTGYHELATIYEYIVAIIMLPFYFFGISTHFSMLLVNWLLASLTIVESLKLANNLYPLKGLNTNLIGMFFIMFNSNYINGSVHLYRDVMMCYFFILSINLAIKKKYLYSFIFVLLTGFIRGANGFIALLLLFFLRYRYTLRYLNKVHIVLICFVVIIILLASDSIVGYSRYLRSFSGDQSEMSLIDRIETRKNKFHENSEVSGVLALIESNNPVVKLMAIPIYMISPIKIAELFVVENYKNEEQLTVLKSRFRIEFLWELIHVFFMAFFTYYLFAGIYYLVSDKDKLKFVLSILLFLIIYIITFVSMQYRHKMMFILLFPLLYRAYKYNVSFYGRKTKEIPIVIMFACVFFIYNVIR